MDKSYRTEFRRTFLIDALPEPLSRAGAHVQIFDNYITGTRIRLRRVRDPQSGNTSHLLQQIIPVGAGQPGIYNLAEMYLNEAEYAQFRIFEGNEIRKNRYFQEFGELEASFDLYLGELWGLVIARIDYPDAASMAASDPPAFAVKEITGNQAFYGTSLYTKSIQEVRADIERTI